MEIAAITMVIIPTEYDEQIALIQYLELKGYKYFRVPNETYTKSWRQKRLNKALGVKAGVPDLFVIADNTLLAIELKRTKGSTTSASQIEWIAALNSAGIPARICKGCTEAINFIQAVVHV